jgi:AcrR family transcriptional regulator
VFTAVVMKTTRTYTMRARADAAAETRQRILDAALRLGEERLSLDIVLADVAERADVSVQTVLRHFGSKDGLFTAVEAHAIADVVEERAAPVGDVGAAVRSIVAHYENRGDWALRMLAQEHVDERYRRQAENGRALHRRWVCEVFAPQLAVGDDPALVDLLVLATDVYAWKLLRRDTGLDRPTTEERLLRLVRSLLARTEES